MPTPAPLVLDTISASDKLIKIETEWNDFIRSHSGNPFFLSGFMKEIIEYSRLQGSKPTVLVFYVAGSIVGMAPLKVRKKDGISFATFLYDSSLSPDFVFDDRYRELCIDETFRFVSKVLKCQFTYLVLPHHSINLKYLTQKENHRWIKVSPDYDIGHCILPVKGSWFEFEASMGGGFKRRFKKMERRLNQIGSWKIDVSEEGKGESDLVRKILYVEGTSWKQKERDQRKSDLDYDLMMILNGMRYMARIEPDFRWAVFFLDHDDNPLAYQLTFQYKDTAYIVKISFNEQYRRFYPGIFVLNATIRQFFTAKQVSRIDFLTDLPFMENWKPSHFPRYRVLITQNPLFILAEHALIRKPLKKPAAALSRKIGILNVFG
jgi:CelD/BcsL family acetyltransferase involved in cellulose biosynthesis